MSTASRIILRHISLNYTRGNGMAKRGCANLGFLVFCLLGNGCERAQQGADLRPLERALADIENADAAAMAGFCTRLGPAAVTRIQDEARHAPVLKHKMKLLTALLRFDANGQLPFVLDVMEENAEASSYMALLLPDGLFDCDSQRYLHEQIRTTHGGRRRVAVAVAGMLADDQRSLELARWILYERTPEPETIDNALEFLITAAYFNNDPTAVEDLRRAMDSAHAATRFCAFMGLLTIPGEEAEHLWIETARTTPDRYSERLIQERIQQRKEALATGTRVARGWRKDLSREDRACEFADPVN